jgi:hypothetical protein
MFKVFACVCYVGRQLYRAYADDIGVYGVSRDFQYYFSYIVAVSVIGGENHRSVVGH